MIFSARRKLGNSPAGAELVLEGKREEKKDSTAEDL